MNKSSAYANHGNKTSQGSMGIARYRMHIQTMILIRSGLRLNCSTNGRRPRLILVLIASPVASSVAAEALFVVS
jgi:hypothetical protein